MVSAPESNFLSERHKNKVPHLFNRNFSEISEKSFLLGQLQLKTVQGIRPSNVGLTTAMWSNVGLATTGWSDVGLTTLNGAM